MAESSIIQERLIELEGRIANLETTIQVRDERIHVLERDNESLRQHIDHVYHQWQEAELGHAKNDPLRLVSLELFRNTQQRLQDAELEIAVLKNACQLAYDYYQNECRDRGREPMQLRTVERALGKLPKG